MRDLSYNAHGGSGYGHGYRDLLEMDVRDAFSLVELLSDQRDKENKAIARANAKPAR